jgi:flagellar biosynthesis/type III secretory pathway chaperone
MSSHGSAFTRLVEQESSTASALLECLRAEKTALQSNSAEQLETVVMRKIELVKTMTQHAIDRTELLRQAGFSIQADDIQAFMRQYAAQTPPLWQALLDTAAALEQQNRINGSMINLSQQRNQMALDLLTGNDAKSKTYGKQGYAENDPTSFTSVKA